jgi:prolyl oligopeptidase
MKQITTKRQEEVYEMNGIKISDPYMWLEDGNDPQVKEWTDIQNEIVANEFNNEINKVFSDELAKNLKTVSFSNPVLVGNRYFYTERKPNEDQFVLYYKDGLNGESKKIFDPNGKRQGNTITIDFRMESKTGKYIAYGISEGGNEMATMYIKDIDNDKELPEKIVHCRYSKIRWLSDDSGFYYTRNPRPGSVPKNEEHLHPKIYFHKLGDNPDNDELIFGEGRPKDDMISMTLSLDGRYLSIHVSGTWSENDVYIYDSKTKKTTSFITGIKSKFTTIFLSDKVLMYTNYKANNYRVLYTTYEELFKPINEWKEFIPEKEYLLQSVNITKSKIITEYMVNACSILIIFDYQGKEIENIPLPEYTNVINISTRREEEEFFYNIDSFTYPNISFRYDPILKKYQEYRRAENPINPDDYVIKQEWYFSKDNTKIPLFIFHKKGIELNGNNPTILYGYGGFGNIESPSYMRNNIPWIKRGGIFAIANIRGGGEFGEDWHKQGIKDKKQNSFDDFICAAEYLINKKYTNSNQLGIFGGSNGGLLVSAVGIQRPELFKAICSKVPLTDMVRFPKFGIASRWIHEYGNPEIKQDLFNILKWSPYHNVKKDIKYPDFLFTTAEKDTRVDPLHARKMVAMLQENSKENEVYLYTSKTLGH